MNKKIIVVTLLISLVAVVFARDVKMVITDAELEFPLEGVKLNLKGKQQPVFYTDENGEAVISISDDPKSEPIETHLPGYKNEQIKIKPDDDFIEVTLSIADVIVGQELVVNRAAPETKEEKVGVSTVMTKEEMHQLQTWG